jgi:hypothetical protein
MHMFGAAEGSRWHHAILLLERKARYRRSHRAILAAKQRLYRLQERNMIKHGKIHKFKEHGKTPSHLMPIKEFITKGIADAKEKIVLSPQACDVKGAKRFNGQQCVIAKALTRTMHPQAVAVGRSLAYAVFNGLAIRFRVPTAARKVVEEFDSNGKVKKADIVLDEINPTWGLSRQRQRRKRDEKPRKKYAKRNTQYGVRAIGGGVSH